MANKYNPIFGTKVVVLGCVSSLTSKLRFSIVVLRLTSFSPDRGSSGMGFAAAEISLDRQAIVFIGSSSQTKCDAAVSLLKKSYPKGEVYGKTVNLTDDSSIKEYFGWVNAIGNPGVDRKAFETGCSGVP